jgi:hypothetical protein
MNYEACSVMVSLKQCQRPAIGQLARQHHGEGDLGMYHHLRNGQGVGGLT